MIQRKRDYETEQNLALFLDKHFYPHLLKSNIVSDVKRVSEKSKQVSGIDIIVKANYKTTNVDEKVVTNYPINKLKKFGFEIFSFQNSGVRDGWLIDESLSTDAYLLGWLLVEDCALNKEGLINDKRVIKEEEILEMELLLVSCKEIRRYLSSSGFPLSKLNELKSNVLRNNVEFDEQGFIGIQEYKNHKRDFHFTYSIKKDEKPFMVNIRKDKLRELAKKYYIVDREKVITYEYDSER